MAEPVEVERAAGPTPKPPVAPIEEDKEPDSGTRGLPAPEPPASQPPRPPPRASARLADVAASSTSRVGFTPSFCRLFFEDERAGAPAALRGRTLTRVHADPHVYVIDNFLTERELEYFDDVVCAQRRARGGGGGFVASYTDGDDGRAVLDAEHRTSTFCTLRKGGNALVRAIDARAAELCGLPADNGEPFQLVAYKDGQFFETHHDLGTLSDDGGAVAHDGGPRRLATVFVYLNTLPRGQGATEFPALAAPRACRAGRGAADDDAVYAGSAPPSGPARAAGHGGARAGSLCVRPRRGAALLFSNVNADGAPDARTQHRAAPVAAGYEKFGLNVWLTDCSQQAFALSSVGVNVAPGQGIAARAKGGGVLAALEAAVVGPSAAAAGEAAAAAAGSAKAKPARAKKAPAAAAKAARKPKHAKAAATGKRAAATDAQAEAPPAKSAKGSPGPPGGAII